MLVTLSQILKKAQRGKYAVGAFNVSNLEMLEGIMDAAISLHSPIILQTTPTAISYAGLQYLYAIMKVATKAPIPVVVHLDHGKDFNLIKECVQIGYNSVMFDGSDLPFLENLRYTKQVVRFAHSREVSVEAEIGAIVGIENAILTDPTQAQVFAKKSECDALAIAIGTSHGAYKYHGESRLNFELLKTIRDGISIPLVLHGASGVPIEFLQYLNKHHRKLRQVSRLVGARGVEDRLIRRAISLGISKINVDTDLRIAFTGGVLNSLLEHPEIFDPRMYLSNAKERVCSIVQQKIRLFGSHKKA